MLDILIVEVHRDKIMTDDLKNISLIASHYLKEVDLVQFAKVKCTDENASYILCWSDSPPKLVEAFLQKYFPLWRWVVND